MLVLLVITVSSLAQLFHYEDESEIKKVHLVEPLKGKAAFRHNVALVAEMMMRGELSDYFVFADGCRLMMYVVNGFETPRERYFRGMKDPLKEKK